jgi:heat shock protein HslJ
MQKKMIGCLTLLVVGLSAAVTIDLVQAEEFPHFTLTQHMAQSSPTIAGSWRLLVPGESPDPSVSLDKLEMTAEFKDGRISGSGGCNRFFGRYSTDGVKLSISQLASTEMACGETVMKLEQQYLAALQGAQIHEFIENGDLRILFRNPQEWGALRFTRQQQVRGLW